MMVNVISIQQVREENKIQKNIIGYPKQTQYLNLTFKMMFNSQTSIMSLKTYFKNSLLSCIGVMIIFNAKLIIR